MIISLLLLPRDQEKENIDAIDIELSDEIMNKINLIHNNNPNPSP